MAWSLVSRVRKSPPEGRVSAFHDQRAMGWAEMSVWVWEPTIRPDSTLTTSRAARPSGPPTV